MADLKTVLQDYDGRALTLLSEARARYGQSENFIGDLVSLMGAEDKFISEGAIWLIKNCAEDGVQLRSENVAGIVARLGAISSWQSALLLCQTARFFQFQEPQARTFGLWASRFLEHSRPFLRAWSMDAIQHAARQAPDLAPLAAKALTRAGDDKAASVRARARQYQNL